MSVTFQVTDGTSGAKDPGKEAQVQSYLEKHQVHEFLTAVFDHLLTQKPRDPYAFLADCLQKASDVVDKPHTFQGSDDQLSGSALLAQVLKASTKSTSQQQLQKGSIPLEPLVEAAEESAASKPPTPQKSSTSQDATKEARRDVAEESPTQNAEPQQSSARMEQETAANATANASDGVMLLTSEQTSTNREFAPAASVSQVTWNHAAADEQSCSAPVPSAANISARHELEESVQVQPQLQQQQIAKEQQVASRAADPASQISAKDQQSTVGAGEALLPIEASQPSFAQHIVATDLQAGAAAGPSSYNGLGRLATGDMVVSASAAPTEEEPKHDAAGSGSGYSYGTLEASDMRPRGQPLAKNNTVEMAPPPPPDVLSSLGNVATREVVLPASASQLPQHPATKDSPAGGAAAGPSTSNRDGHVATNSMVASASVGQHAIAKEEQKSDAAVSYGTLEASDMRPRGQTSAKSNTVEMAPPGVLSSTGVGEAVPGVNAQSGQKDPSSHTEANHSDDLMHFMPENQLPREQVDGGVIDLLHLIPHHGSIVDSGLQSLRLDHTDDDLSHLVPTAITGHDGAGRRHSNDIHSLSDADLAHLVPSLIPAAHVQVRVGEPSASYPRFSVLSAHHKMDEATPRLSHLMPETCAR